MTLVALTVAFMGGVGIGVWFAVRRSSRSVRSIEADLRADVAEAEAETRRITDLFDRLEVGLESVDIGVVVADTEGAIVSRNAVAATIAEARHSEALVASAVNDLLEVAGRGESGERLVELAGPPARSYQVRAHPITRGGESLGSIAYISDVSESRRVDRVRRDFVTNVSHELKTPVGAMSLLAETLSVDDEPEVMERLIGRIQSEARRVADTVDDLMTLSAIEERDDSRFTVLDLREVVAGAIERLEEAADLKGVELHRPVAGDPLTIVGERLQLESAVFNLIDNAVKYCERDDHVEIRLAQGAGLVAVAVQDNGVGIPTTELERIFERFYRVDKARSRDTGGTGLGLSIVRHVIHNHGGEIEVASREGEGSTFTILLPAASEELDMSDLAQSRIERR